MALHPSMILAKYCPSTNSFMVGWDSWGVTAAAYPKLLISVLLCRATRLVI